MAKLYLPKELELTVFYIDLNSKARLILILNCLKRTNLSGAAGALPVGVRLRVEQAARAGAGPARRHAHSSHRTAPPHRAPARRLAPLRYYIQPGIFMINKRLTLNGPTRIYITPVSRVRKHTQYTSTNATKHLYGQYKSIPCTEIEPATTAQQP